jgi:hypothetical protein
MYTNLNSSNYLSKCDLIHKLAVNNIYKCPEISKISVLFSLKQLKNKSISRKEINIRIKGFLLLYIMFGLNPIIEYHSEKIKDYSLKKANTSFYTQRISLDNKNDINNFIHFLFIENNLKTFSKSVIIKKTKIENSTLMVTMTFPLSTFTDIFEFCASDIIDFPAKELNVQVIFFLNNYTSLKESNFSIISPFWHFG